MLFRSDGRDGSRGRRQAAVAREPQPERGQVGQRERGSGPDDITQGRAAGVTPDRGVVRSAHPEPVEDDQGGASAQFSWPVENRIRSPVSA